MKITDIKILITVAIALVAITTVTSTVTNVSNVCKTGGLQCSTCCGQAYLHCKSYCKPLGCNPFQPDVCDANDGNRFFKYSFNAKGCPSVCMSVKRRTLEYKGLFGDRVMPVEAA